MLDTEIILEALRDYRRWWDEEANEEPDKDKLHLIDKAIKSVEELTPNTIWVGEDQVEHAPLVFSTERKVIDHITMIYGTRGEGCDLVIEEGRIQAFAVDDEGESTDDDIIFEALECKID